MNKHEIEARHLEQFITLLSEEVISFEVNPTPEPDFSLKIDEKLIGVEHTRLFLAEDIKGDNIVIHNKIADTIMSDAESLFLIVSNQKLTVTVSFYSSYGLAVDSKMLCSQDIKPLSKFIADFVHRNIPEKGEGKRFERFDFEQGKYILPDKIRSISIWHKFSCWSAVKGGVVPRIQSKSLEYRIAQKDKKPKNYRGKYDELWLLIVENGWSMESYFDFDDVHAIYASSVFNKVYILRSGDNKIYEVQNQMPSSERWQPT